MKYHFLIHFITFLAFVSAVQASSSGKGGKGSGSVDDSVDDSGDEGVGDVGGVGTVPVGGGNDPVRAVVVGVVHLIEPTGCQPFNTPQVQQCASNTVGGCASNSCDGCCRLHTAFLTCDAQNTFTQLSCVCNDRTNNVHLVNRAATGGSSTGARSAIRGSGVANVPAPGTATVSSSCMDGSEWQKLGLEQYTNCAAGIDCAGVTLSDGVTPTCCKK